MENNYDDFEKMLEEFINSELDNDEVTFGDEANSSQEDVDDVMNEEHHEDDVEDEDDVDLDDQEDDSATDDDDCCAGIVFPDGERYLALVILRAEPSLNLNSLCASPLPYVFVPTIEPALLSCIAAAKISDALAVFSFTSTATGSSHEASSELKVSFLPFLYSRYPIVHSGRI